ncbi:hypothetical protein BC830DRAFT_1152805 [Chytriomyces sp. MP71]|nr:hypothetical protein BC830DRAFT_1152805 [Chytriomyces sp. MP71]
MEAPSTKRERDEDASVVAIAGSEVEKGDMERHDNVHSGKRRKMGTDADDGVCVSRGEDEGEASTEASLARESGKAGVGEEVPSTAAEGAAERVTDGEREAEGVAGREKVTQAELGDADSAGPLKNTDAETTLGIAGTVSVPAVKTEGETNATRTATSATASDPPKLFRSGQVTVVNDNALLAIPQKKHLTSLGRVIYRAPSRTISGSTDPASLRLFLLPEFNTNHLYATIDVLIPAEFLSYTRNPGVQCRALWGTDIYTDDSDVVAVVIHSGHYRPFDAPAFAHHVTTTTREVDRFKASAASVSAQKQDITSVTAAAAPTSASDTRTAAAPASPFTSTEAQPTTTTSSAATTDASDPAPIHTETASTLTALRDLGARPPIPTHDLLVTLRVLPRLKKYTGTRCAPLSKKKKMKLPTGEDEAAQAAEDEEEPEEEGEDAGSSEEDAFASRGWGASHQGESIRVERVVEVERGCRGYGHSSRVSTDSSARVASGLGTWGAVGRGRKVGAVEWCMIGVHERVFAPPAAAPDIAAAVVASTAAVGAGAGAVGAGVASSTSIGRTKRKGSLAPGALMGQKKELYDVVRVLFSSVDGRTCFKYAPQVLNEWPKYLQDGLVDMTATDCKGDSALMGLQDDQDQIALCFKLSGPQLKRMEGWAFWRVRLSVPGTVLHLEDDVGSRLARCYYASSVTVVEPTKKTKTKKQLRNNTEPCKHWWVCRQLYRLRYLCWERG